MLKNIIFILLIINNKLIMTDEGHIKTILDVKEDDEGLKVIQPYILISFT